MVDLVPFDETHFDLLIKWTPDSQFLLQWAGQSFTFPLDRQQLERLSASGGGSPPSAHLFMARRIADSTLVGHGELGLINHGNRSAKLMRILVGPQRARGCGYGECLMRKLVRFGFEELNLHRLYLDVLEFNTAAIRCYERVGFQLEGTQREDVHQDDQYLSTCVMELLRREWDAA